MANYKEKLPSITTFIFDFDGVLSDGKVWALPNGEQLRATNVKDGYAIQYALKLGYNICILSGGYSEGMYKRYEGFKGMDIFLKIPDKMKCFQQYLKDKKLSKEQILYMGDDIPDYHVMSASGLKACPKDAAIEIQELSDYISPFNGGCGCVRDVIEQTLRCKNQWFNEESHIW